MNINDGSHLEKPCHFSLHIENIWRLLFCPLLGCLLACIPDQSYTAICLCSWQCCWAKPSSECKAALDAACPRTVPQQLCSLYFCQPEIQRRDTTIRSDKGILAIWRDTISFASAYIQSRFRANSLPLERQKWDCNLIVLPCTCQIYPTLSSWMLAEILSASHNATRDRFFVFFLVALNSLTYEPQNLLPYHSGVCCSWCLSSLMSVIRFASLAKH